MITTHPGTLVRFYKRGKRGEREVREGVKEREGREGGVKERERRGWEGRRE